jgi:hypothetical protein
MNKINKVISFIDYISKNMEKDDLFLLYKINNVKRERMEMLSDLTYSLNELILTTYLGDQFMNDEDRIKHFNWCWESVVSSFKKEGIYFLDCDELKKYFKSFYDESFYNEDKENQFINQIGKFWDELLDYGSVKTMSEYESFLEIYKIFNKSFVVN